jgi:RecB family exonuclease
MEHVRHRRVVSADALKKFATCPVQWLVERQLDPADLAPEAEVLARGTFMHHVLERVISGLGAPLTDENLPDAELALTELTSEPPADLAPGRPQAIRAAILGGIEADLRRYLRFEAADGNDWTPTEFELEFEVEIGAGEDAIGLRGFVDRVDIDPATGRRAIIKDYKSGANRPERASARWLADHELQVGLYMLAVRRLLGLEPVAGFYQPLTGRDLRPRGVFAPEAPVGRRAVRTDGLSGEELGQLLADVEQQALALAAQLRTGELTPRPERCSRSGCRHPGICWAA